MSVLGMLVALGLSAGPAPGLPSSSIPRISGWVRSPAVAELSGLAPSTLRDGRYWAINDSGSAAELLLLDDSGALRGKVKVHDAPNRDWEELASYRHGGRSWLMVADSGDNQQRQIDQRLYFFHEPRRARGSVSPQWTLRYRYPERAYDSEGAFVDARAGKVYLTSKRINPARLFELPLRPTADGEVLEARQVGTFGGILLPDPDYSHHTTNFLRYAAEITGADLSCDGRTLALLTYSRLYFYRRQPGQDWSAAIARPADSITLPPLPQAEAVAYSRDCARVLVGSEQPPVPLLAWPVRP